jgi:single-strand DNA-binding protein
VFNRITLIGRLVRDPELRTTTTGKNVADFSIAVNKRFKPRDSNEPDADFFRVSAWGQTAEYVSNYLSKGRLVVVDGRIESRKWTDKEGHTRESWDVTAETVSALDRPKDDGAPGGGGSSRPAGGSAPSADEYDPFADE